MTTGLFWRRLVNTSIARAVLSAGTSIELKRPCSARFVRSVVYFVSVLTGRSSRFLDCAWAPSETKIPASNDSERPTAMAKRQPIQISGGGVFMFGLSKSGDCSIERIHIPPQSEVQGACPMALAVL